MPSKAKTAIELYAVNAVKAMRIERQMTQADLAAELDLSSGFIGDVESTKNDAKYNLNHLNQLAVLFKCSPKDFLPENSI